MEEQLIEQLNEDISKNFNSEHYHIRKYFGKTPIEEYAFVRMMEVFDDESIAPGIKDSELLDVVLLRFIKSKHFDIKIYNSLKEAQNYLKTLEQING